VNTAWTVNLARHVEARLVSPGRAVALMLIGGLVVFALTFPFFAGRLP
jgi:hypothetical protein